MSAFHAMSILLSRAFSQYSSDCSRLFSFMATSSFRSDLTCNVSHVSKPWPLNASSITLDWTKRNSRRQRRVSKHILMPARQRFSLMTGRR